VAAPAAALEPTVQAHERAAQDDRSQRRPQHVARRARIHVGVPADRGHRRRDHLRRLDPRDGVADLGSLDLRLAPAAWHAAVGGHPAAGGDLSRRLGTPQGGAPRRPPGRGLSPRVACGLWPDLAHRRRAHVLGGVPLPAGRAAAGRQSHLGREPHGDYHLRDRHVHSKPSP
jgi:hypothetical protein